MKIRQSITRFALAATLPVVGVLAIASPAAASKPRSGSTPASCDVEDSVTGKISQVTEGTQAGLMYCGADGQWHFGWAVNARVDTTPKPPVKKPGRAAAAPQATTAVTARRGG